MDNFSREFRLKNAVLIYLEKFKFLESIEATCQRFSNNVIQVPLIYPFAVDVHFMHLLDHDSDLCEFMLKEPVKGRILFQEVIYTAICTLKWLPNLENISQILVTINFTCLPAVPEFRISRFEDLLKCHFPKYYQFIGVIVSLTTPSVYTKGTSYLCPDPSCIGSTGCIFIRVHVPGVGESQTFRNDLQCSYCKSTLKENVKSRVLSEKLVAEMVPIDSFTCTSSCNRHQAIPVYFRDNLVEKVKLGCGYAVIGITAGNLCLPSSYQEKIHLEANHLRPIAFKPFEIKVKPSDFLKMFKSKIENKLHQLGLHDWKSSHYVIPHFIAYYFGESIVAKGLFHKLKLGILLTLASCGRTVAKGNMSLLVVGSDTTLANRLLSYGSSLAPAMIAVTDHQQLKVPISRDNESGGFRMEANAFLLAGGGVCYCGDINKFNITAQRSIAKILESNTVEVEILRDNVIRGSRSSFPPTDYPVECQVWAYASRLSRKQNSAARSFKISSVTDVPNLLLDAFSITYYTDSWSAMDNDQTAAFAMLSTFAAAMGLDEDRRLYSHEDLQMFLKLIQQRDVVFETDAEELIKGYYVASRRLRNSAKNHTEIAITAVATISMMAEAHARLSLRQNVLVEDAIASIFLYEEYLTNRFGSSCFNVQPFPHLNQKDENEDCEMVLKQHETFALNLRNFVSAYGKDFQLETTREE